MRNAGCGPGRAWAGDPGSITLAVLSFFLLSPLTAHGQEPEPARSEAPVYSTALSSPEQLAIRLERVLSDPALIRADVGLVVQVAETGEILFEQLGEKLYVPASNTKIVTGAVALDALGADYRWETRIVADGPIADGVLAGDLWIIGEGDPWLERSELEKWPGLLREAGIRRIEGDVIGDDRAFPGPQWGQGWYWHELRAAWGAGVSALQLSPNTIRARLVPGSIGERARFELVRPGPGPGLQSEVRTGAPGSEVRLEYEPPPEGGDVVLIGWIPAGDTVDLHLAAEHPTLYLLSTLEEAMRADGLGVAGTFRRAKGDEAPATPGWSAARTSAPLGTVLAEMLKESDNQMAESILRTVGREVSGDGTPAGGLEVVEGTLTGWGIEPGAMLLFDGSGLSRYDRIAPTAMARLLRVMWRHPDYPVFRDALPIAAVDGTLRRRMAGTPAEGNVRAKTGSVSAARALSGYLTDGSGETLVFSLFVNDYDVPGSVAVALEDLIIEQVALYRRPVEPGWPAFRNEER